ncbi:hypothetical protein H2248_002914 [Termitomyces sp. 'cryptogamus']|nr:hypothetical protein H2248_002914 [Termitomyces sp. 'cryptogamus']
MEPLLNGQPLLRSLTDKFLNNPPMISRARLKTLAIMKRKARVVIGCVLAINIGCPGVSISDINVLFGVGRNRVQGGSVRQPHFLADVEDAGDKGGFPNSCLQK